MSDISISAGRGFRDLANPTRFMALAGRLIPWLSAAAVILLAVGLWMSFTAPPDYQQGTMVRIMYIHVPFAWLAMLCYTIMAVAARAADRLIERPER